MKRELHVIKDEILNMQNNLQFSVTKFARTWDPEPEN